MKTNNRRLLCVFAHPDDECLGPGGTIAQYVLDGAEVSILMFTCGEAGSIGVSKTMAPEELCSRRCDELAAACDALGVGTLRIVGVPDKGVSDVDEKWAIERILAEFARFKPHVALTFHYGGVSAHPDHIAVARYLEAAFDATAAGSPMKLYEWGIPTERARLYDRANLVTTPDHEIHARITPSAEAMDRKIDAIRCHVTQIDFFKSLEEKFDYRANSSPECFTLRRTRLDPPTVLETDLFAGIETP